MQACRARFCLPAPHIHTCCKRPAATCIHPALLCYPKGCINKYRYNVMILDQRISISPVNQLSRRESCLYHLLRHVRYKQPHCGISVCMNMLSACSLSQRLPSCVSNQCRRTLTMYLLCIDTCMPHSGEASRAAGQVKCTIASGLFC
jgi:hypothetical protein